MARLVAVGVPPRTLLAAQAVQVLLPLGAGVVLAAGCGLILVGAVAWSTGTGLGVISAGVPLFLGVVAALFEIGGAWLVWQGVREHRGWLWIGAGVISLGLYGFFATLQPDASFGRILAAYGGVFIVGSLMWGMAVDGFRPDRRDVVGALVCLVGVALIMYAPRSA